MALVSTHQTYVAIVIETIPDTSCILVWLIEQGYEVYAFLADVGQEEVRGNSEAKLARGLLITSHKGFRSRPQESPERRSEKVLPRG